MTNTQVREVPRQHALLGDSGKTFLVSEHLVRDNPDPAFADKVARHLADLLTSGPAEHMTIYRADPNGTYLTVVAHVGTLVEINQDDDVAVFADGVGVEIDQVVSLKH